jgi:hypothetical protein
MQQLMIDGALAEIQKAQETTGEKIKEDFCAIAPAATGTIEAIMPFVSNPLYVFVLKVADGIIKGVQSRECNQTQTTNETAQ